MKWIRNQASHGFWPGQRACGDNTALAVGTYAKKVASRALGEVYSLVAGQAKMEIPVELWNCSNWRFPEQNVACTMSARLRKL